MASMVPSLAQEPPAPLVIVKPGTAAAIGVDRSLVVDGAGAGVEVGVVDVALLAVDHDARRDRGAPPLLVTLIEPSVNETVPVPRSDCVPLKFRRPPLSMWTVPPERVRPLPMMLSESSRNRI